LASAPSSGTWPICSRSWILAHALRSPPSPWKQASATLAHKLPRKVTWGFSAMPESASVARLMLPAVEQRQRSTESRKWRDTAMRPEQHMQVFRRVIEEGFNTGDLDALDDYFPPTYIEHQFDLAPTLEEFKGSIRFLRDTFAPFNLTIEDM